MTAAALIQTDLPELNLLHRGKVRDMYEIPGHEDKLLMIATDRISAYDVVMNEPVPGTITTVPQLIVAARELRQRILQAAVTPRPAFMMFPAQPAMFPGKKPEDLDIKDSMVFEKANPGNKKSKIGRASCRERV